MNNPNQDQKSGQQNQGGQTPGQQGGQPNQKPGQQTQNPARVASRAIRPTSRSRSAEGIATLRNSAFERGFFAPTRLARAPGSLAVASFAFVGSGPKARYAPMKPFGRFGFMPGQERKEHPVDDGQIGLDRRHCDRRHCRMACRNHHPQQHGLITNIILGVIGAALAGWLFGKLGIQIGGPNWLAIWSPELSAPAFSDLRDPDVLSEPPGVSSRAIPSCSIHAAGMLGRVTRGRRRD